MKAVEEANKGTLKTAKRQGLIQGAAVITDLTKEAQKRLDDSPQQDFRLGHHLVQIMLELPRPIHVKVGQYIGLWTYELGALSAFQTHPFMVTSWSEGKTKQLRLLVEPRNGWTKKLQKFSNDSWQVLFTGPCGVSLPTHDYSIVLLVASGLGLVAQIPYLKQLIHDKNASRTRTRRIHLVWQLESPGMFSIIFTRLRTYDIRSSYHFPGYIKRGSS